MTEFPTPPDDEDGGDADAGRILAPEELDIAEDEHVTQIDDGRFVVSPSERPADDPVGVDAHATPESEPEPDPEPAAGDPDPTLDSDAVHDWLAEDVGSVSSRYGFDVTATFGGSVSQRRLVSNDVVTSFESLVLWYAQHVDDDTPVEEILGILLLESNVPVRYPPRSLERILESTNLGPEDSIADLIAAVEAEDGVQL